MVSGICFTNRFWQQYGGVDKESRRLEEGNQKSISGALESAGKGLSQEPRQ